VFSHHSPVMFSLLHGVVLPKHETPQGGQIEMG